MTRGGGFHPHAAEKPGGMRPQKRAASSSTEIGFSRKDSMGDLDNEEFQWCATGGLRCERKVRR